MMTAMFEGDFEAELGDDLQWTSKEDGAEILNMLNQETEFYLSDLSPSQGSPKQAAFDYIVGFFEGRVIKDDDPEIAASNKVF